MNIATPKFGVGASALRKEDLKLLRGEGRFTDDIKAEGELRGFVVRSPYASAKFSFNDLDRARQYEGVRLVLTAAELTHLGPVICQTPVKQPDGAKHAMKHVPVLCDGEVRYVGDAVAFVVADTLEQAQEAADLIDIEWDTGDAHADLGTALDASSPVVWPDIGSNQAFLYKLGDVSKTDAAFAEADHVTTINFINNRLVCNYMETRACLAEWDVDAGKFTVTLGSQGVHNMRNTLAKDVFRMDRDDIRVITGDVGGGFGTKAVNYRESADHGGCAAARPSGQMGR